MADLPSANVTVDDEAGTFAKNAGYVAVIAPVATNADSTPRVYTSTKALLSQHGYAPGVDYSALHFEEAGTPVVFVGVPIATAGVVGRQNSSGVLGSSAISVAAGGSGALDEFDGVITVVDAGVVATDQISFDLSLDGGRSKKRIRLGTATSYVIPYSGLTVTFGGGTCLADDEFTFSTTAPMFDSDGLNDARVALASQQKLLRSLIVIGDCPSSTLASAIVTEVEAYETANDRFTYARASVRDRLPYAEKSKVTKRMTGAPLLTFAEVGATGDTITRATGSWIADGFAVNDVVTVTASASNNVTGRIASLSATVLTFDTTDLVAEGPVAGVTVTGSEGLTFAEVGGTGDTLTRSTGSWLADGFRDGDIVTISDTASNNVSGEVTGVTATVLTFGSTDLAAEGPIRSDAVTVTAGETMAAWVASTDAAFAIVDSKKRIDLALGRARKASYIHRWLMRRPASWAASVREYQHDVHIATYAKELGPLSGWDMTDGAGNVVEYDERTDGGALAAKFTCLRTYSNGPIGAFVALSLTRAEEGSLLSRTHNLAVANVACTVVHAETERAIGKSLVLKADGTGDPAALSRLEQSVNKSLQIALLQEGLEGPRASAAKWVASRTDVLNIPGAELNGTLDLLLNGTIEKINTRVRVLTGG